MLLGVDLLIVPQDPGLDGLGANTANAYYITPSSMKVSQNLVSFLIAII